MSSFSTSDSSDASPTSDCSTSASDCSTSASSLLLVSDRPSPALEINEVSVGVGLFIPTSRCEAGAVVGQACFSDFRSPIDKGEAEECHLKEKMSGAGERLSRGGECVSGFDKKDVEGDRLGEPEHGGFFVADNCQGGGGLVGERGESSTLAEGCQAAVRNFEVGGSVADKRCDTERFMEDEEYLMVWPRTEKADGCQLRGKACGAEEEVVAEGSRSLSLVENLTKSLGLGSSTDSEEEEMRDEDLGADICLAMVAEERQPVAIEELGVNDVMLLFEADGAEAEKGDGSSGWLLVGAVDKGGGERVELADDCRMREGEVEEVGVSLDGHGSRESIGAVGWLTTVGDFEKKRKIKRWGRGGPPRRGGRSLF